MTEANGVDRDDLHRRVTALCLPWSVGLLDRGVDDATGDHWGEMETRGGATCLVAVVNALPALLARVTALEAAARDLLDDDDLGTIVASDDAYARWVVHRANLALLLEEV